MISQSQRERLLAAALAVATEKGYAAMTIGDLAKRAGVSRTTFYELFADKEACFLAAYDDAVDRLNRTVTDAYEAQQRWPERVAAALRALLDAVEREPTVARLSFVDVAAVGTGAQRRYRGIIQRLAPLFDEGRDFSPTGRSLPANTSRMAVGAVTGLIADLVLGDDTDKPTGLLSDALFGTLTPYVGPDAAAREVNRLAR